MATHNLVYPQWDYGQGTGAWIPATSAPVYRQMEKARFWPRFAVIFAADIILAKPETGNDFYYWVESGQGFRRLFGRTNDRGYLYNENTLNASKTGVGLMFGPPAIFRNGEWHHAFVCTMFAYWEEIRIEDKVTGEVTITTELRDYGKPEGADRFTFEPGGLLRDSAGNEKYLRMLAAGHVAFSARDSLGVTVRVPWADGYEPLKEYRGQPETGNAKLRPVGRYYV